VASTTKASVQVAPIRRTGWIIGPTMLAATVCAVILLRQGLDRTFAWALAALLTTILVWILVSVFWPARPDRTCPTCGSPALRRSDGRTTRGIVCNRCGYEDPDQSSFLIAEDEEGAIESIVIEERNGRRGRTR
jgi:hypothetical protein